MRVTAIEKDRVLAAEVQEALPNVRVTVGDALTLDWRATAGAGPGEPLYVAGNIPYNITSPLIGKALTPPRPARIVFLVQAEVADRLSAEPWGPDYGALSIGVQAVARVQKLFRVPAGAFHPRPRVDSAVVRLIPLEQPLVADGDLDSFRRMVVGIFGYRRKQLVRGLRELTGWPAVRVTGVLDSLEMPGANRPEAVPPAGFVRLHRRLIDEGWEGG